MKTPTTPTPPERSVEEIVKEAIERCAVEVWKLLAEYEDRFEPTPRTKALSEAIKRIRALSTNTKSV